MRISFYVTLLTMTGAAVCALGLLKNTSSLATKRDHFASGSIDYTPTGSTEAIEAMKALQQRDRMRKAAHSKAAGND